MKKQNILSSIFISFLKIGLFSFGGGLSMIPLMEQEFIKKRKWISHEDFLDLIVVAESTPGPIAINAATYIGYKVSKIIGSLVATIATCIPSFVIIYIISLFFDAFLQNQIVANAFKGIQVCVVYLIISAGWNLFKKTEKTLFNSIMTAGALFAMIAVSLFEWNISSIFFILIGATIGIIIYVISFCRKESQKKEEEQK